MKLKSIALAIAVLACQQTAFAQQPPGIGDVLKQVPPSAPRPAAAPLPQISGASLAPPLQKLPGGGEQVRIESVEVVGNREIDNAPLLELVKDAAGKSFTVEGLEQLATRLTLYYRTQGYFVARAYVPAQDITSGRLTLRVVEGNYGRFVLDNKSRVRDDIVQGLLDDVKKYDIVSLDTLERAMLIINDTPGVRVVRADVMPGQQVGTSDFAIGTEATAARNGYIALDNHGSVYTGRTRLSGSVDWNSPSGRGDRLSLAGVATDGSGLLNGRLAYSSLVSTDGTRLEAALSRTQYTLGDRYADLGAEGRANSVEATLSRPVKRTRAHSLDASLLIAMRELTDDVQAAQTSVKKRSVSLGAELSLRREHAWLGLDGQTRASVSVTTGNLSIRDPQAQALDAAGSRTAGHWTRLNLSVARTSVLPQQWLATASLKAQTSLAGKNLDGSERMSVSGAHAVAAYPAGELSGDRAVLLRLELSRDLGTVAGLAWNGGVFTDHGWAEIARSIGNMDADRYLAGVGLSLGASMGRGGFAKLMAVHRTSGGAPTSEPLPKTRVLVQAGFTF